MEGEQHGKTRREWIAERWADANTVPEHPHPDVQFLLREVSALRAALGVAATFVKGQKPEAIEARITINDALYESW